MARKDPQVNIRLPSELKEKLEAVAGRSGRSLTAEIVHRLEDSLLAFGDPPEDYEAPSMSDDDRLILNIAMAKSEVRRIAEVLADVQEMAENITGKRLLSVDDLAKSKD